MNSLTKPIKVGFDPKGKKLIMGFPFAFNDLARRFPSRRFDPKTKMWKMGLTKGNLAELTLQRINTPYLLDDDAEQALKDFSQLTAPIRYIDFPRFGYDFTKSTTQFVPFKHQWKALDKTWNLKSAMWMMKMGTGKTFGAIHLACARFQLGLIDAVGIVCPSTLRPTWRKEFKKYATSEYDFVIHDSQSRVVEDWIRETRHEPTPGVLPVLAISVEGLGVSAKLYDSACGFFHGRRVMLVIDESSRIKNPDALRTNRTIEFQPVTEYRLALNGTPIAKGIQDLWSQYEALDPNIIGAGDYWTFKTRYVVMGGYENKQIVGYQHLEELMTLIEPYTVEVGKDVLDLPEKIPYELIVNATKEQKHLLKLIKTGEKTKITDPDVSVKNVLEKVLRWRQVVGGWLPRAVPRETTDKVTGEIMIVWDTVLEALDENPKMDALFDRIADNRIGTKWIIWSSFVHEIEAIADKLKKLYGEDSVGLYYGKVTDPEERSRVEDAYCDPDSGLDFFVGNPSSAGLGLTLISKLNDVTVYYSGTNAFIDRTQSSDRPHRIGTINPVLEIDIVMENTIDEIIQASIAAKLDIEEYIMTRMANPGGIAALFNANTNELTGDVPF